MPTRRRLAAMHEMKERFTSMGMCKCYYCDDLGTATSCPSCHRTKDTTIQTTQHQEEEDVMEKSSLKEKIEQTSESSESIEGFRHALHCQRTLDLSSNRIQIYFDQFLHDCINTSHRTPRFEDGIRILRHKSIVEIRQVLMNYMALWKQCEDTREANEKTCLQTSTQLNLAYLKIKELTTSLDAIKMQKNEENVSVALMAQFWEKEKHVLRLSWEAESAQEIHETIVKLMEEVNVREKVHLEKLNAQKNDEMRSMEATLDARNRAQMEMMAGNIALSCKTKMERQILKSYEELSLRTKTRNDTQRTEIQTLKKEVTTCRKELAEKDAMLLERTRLMEDAHALSTKREMEVQVNFQEQLKTERDQSASLRRQLEHLHTQQITRDMR